MTTILTTHETSTGDAPTCGNPNCADDPHGPETFCTRIRCPNFACREVHPVRSTCRLCRDVFGSVPTVWRCPAEGVDEFDAARCICCNASVKDRALRHGRHRPSAVTIFERAEAASVCDGRWIPAADFVTILGRAIRSGEIPPWHALGVLQYLARDWRPGGPFHRTSLYGMTPADLERLADEACTLGGYLTEAAS